VCVVWERKASQTSQDSSSAPKSAAVIRSIQFDPIGVFTAARARVCVCLFWGGRRRPLLVLLLAQTSRSLSPPPLGWHFFHFIDPPMHRTRSTHLHKQGGCQASSRGPDSTSAPPTPCAPPPPTTTTAAAAAATTTLRSRLSTPSPNHQPQPIHPHAPGGGGGHGHNNNNNPQQLQSRRRRRRR
jgi:hypothetical protein